MSLFNNKKEETADFKYIVGKTFLTSDEMSGFIDAIVESVVNSENENNFPYYAIKHDNINSFTMAIYLNAVSKSKIDEEPNVYNIIRDIKAQIDTEQYYDMLMSIDEGIKFELHKKTANFGLGDLGDPADMMVQLQGLMEQIQNDPKIQKVVDLGINDQAVKSAQKEVKKVQKAKKTVQK